MSDAGEAPVKAMSFEEAMQALEAVVRRLESGDAPLEDSIALYERGARLREHCERKLRAAEARIEKIVADADGRATGTEAADAG